MPNHVLTQIKKTLQNLQNPDDAKHLMRFFKCGKGEYAEGDQFLGIRVPETRKVANAFAPLLNLEDCKELLISPIHEERHLALILLVKKFSKNQEQIYRLYLAHTDYINNWDLVDVSAAPIVGGYLENRDKEPLSKLALSHLMWERRIAIIATLHFIKKGEFQETLKIAKILLSDTHDLIHKAVGWMLREVGKKNQSVEEQFLDAYCEIMPRTMLRYAIEKFEESKRKTYLGRR